MVAVLMALGIAVVVTRPFAGGSGPESAVPASPSPEPAVSALSSAPVQPAAPSPSATPAVPVAAPPEPEIVALADQMHLTEAGRTLFYASSPSIVSYDAAAQACRLETAIGCFSAAGISIGRPSDSRLDAAMVTTAAHELLHAAYVELSARERADIDALVEVAVAVIPADDQLHERIAASVAGIDADLGTERFAYLGSEVWPDGGFDPELEAYYARWIADRAALVAVRTGYWTMLDGLASEVSDGWSAVAELEQAAAQARAEATAAGNEYAQREERRQNIAAQLSEAQANAGEEAGGWIVTVTAPDGTTSEVDAHQWLTDEAAALEALATTLPGLESSAAAAEAAAETERKAVAALAADVEQLFQAAA